MTIPFCTALHVYHGCYHIPSIHLGREYTDRSMNASDTPTSQASTRQWQVIMKELDYHFLDRHAETRCMLDHNNSLFGLALVFRSLAL